MADQPIADAPDRLGEQPKSHAMLTPNQALCRHLQAYERIAIPPEIAVELDQAGPLHTDWRR